MVDGRPVGKRQSIVHPLDNDSRALNVDHFDQGVRLDEDTIGGDIDQETSEPRLAGRAQWRGGPSGFADQERQRFVAIGR